MYVYFKILRKSLALTIMLTENKTSSYLGKDHISPKKYFLSKLTSKQILFITASCASGEPRLRVNFESTVQLVNF